MSTGRIEPSEAPAIASALGCDRADLLVDDMYSYDTMSGVDCFYPGGETIALRIYRHDSSVDRALDDLTPTFNATNRVTVGANWYATGTPGRLVQLAATVGVTATPTDSYVPHPQAVSDELESIGTCSGFVTSLIFDALFDQSAYHELLPGTVEVYPGLEAIVQAIANEAGADQHLTADTFHTRITAYGKTVKAYCAGLWTSTEGTPE
ncbi:hypothetical protein [Leifsonia sp. Le1]|uniref:hypothetical protein n=1 Tax=Leifsonia sp. Le1 TaxID=3404918 RepID=UPI003EC122B8